MSKAFTRDNSETDDDDDGGDEGESDAGIAGGRLEQHGLAGRDLALRLQ